MPDNAARHLYWQIMLPGALLGTIVGFSTIRYGSSGSAARLS
jgi:hypothetical protein